MLTVFFCVPQCCFDDLTKYLVALFGGSAEATASLLTGMAASVQPVDDVRCHHPPLAFLFETIRSARPVGVD